MFQTRSMPAGAVAVWNLVLGLPLISQTQYTSTASSRCSACASSNALAPTTTTLSGRASTSRIFSNCASISANLNSRKTWRCFSFCAASRSSETRVSRASSTRLHSTSSSPQRRSAAARPISSSCRRLRSASSSRCSSSRRRSPSSARRCKSSARLLSWSTRSDCIAACCLCCSNCSSSKAIFALAPWSDWYSKSISSSFRARTSCISLWARARKMSCSACASRFCRHATSISQRCCCRSALSTQWRPASCWSNSDCMLSSSKH
mmetsp:Transcript_22329/g.47585  ORF Transcript_22329/g.47585 Transcript_22329/m.47585 type:complete len:264 (+) Transcript_22329:491-1282(+)